MFNNKNEKNPGKVNGTSPQSPQLNMISEGTKIKGTLNSQNDVRIAGRVEGEAISKSKLIVTSTGDVEGDIKAAEADVAGKVEGQIKVTSKLILRQTAVVGGDIFTKTLVVEEGAQMNGSCRMGNDIKALEGADDSEFAEATKLKQNEN